MVRNENRTSMQGKRLLWDDATIELLRRKYPTTPASDIADEIGCSAPSVMRMAKKLGIEKDPSFDRNNYIGRYARNRGRYNIYK